MQDRSQLSKNDQGIWIRENPYLEEFVIDTVGKDRVTGTDGSSRKRVGDRKPKQYDVGLSISGKSLLGQSEDTANFRMPAFIAPGVFLVVSHSSGHTSDKGNISLLNLDDPENLTADDTSEDYDMEITYFVSGQSSLAVVGNYAYVLESRGASFYVIDLTTSPPEITGSVVIGDEDKTTRTVSAMTNDYAYVTTSSDDMYIVNVQDPTNPTAVFKGEIVFDVTSAFMPDADSLFLASFFVSKVMHLPVSDPNAAWASLPGSWLKEDSNSFAQCDGLVANDDYVFVISRLRRKLVIIPRASPESDTYIGGTGEGDNPDLVGLTEAIGISSDGNQVYTYNRTPNRRFAIWDVSTTPTAPTLLGAVTGVEDMADGNQIGASMLNVGDYVYYGAVSDAGSPGMISAIDVSDPTNPTKVASQAVAGAEAVLPGTIQLYSAT
jgi:hypothetical protein